jgi:alginate O-acetyltransferase complex protein AlgI
MVSSVLFYSYSNIIHLLRLIVLSMLFNYWLGGILARNDEAKKVKGVKRKHILWVGVAANIASLAYFKYTDFLIENVNFVLGTHLALLQILLPLGISFFTFQEIAYLVDSYNRKTSEYSFINYALFVSFFPQLIAGPIVHHKEMITQFEDERNSNLNYENVALGLYFLVMGLFKKVVIADTFAFWATNGFDNHQAPLRLIEAWATSLSYTLQLYFDFSGYTDMAIGAGLIFNIKIPVNFNSPYKALDIGDFWRRWHMTLSRFWKQYLYVPQGGNRYGDLVTVRNLLIVFLIGGIWHGAGWSFVIWGALHGIAMVIYKAWRKLEIDLPKVLAWCLTFNFVNAAWVFFRARTLEDGIKVLAGMAGANGVTLPIELEPVLGWLREFGVEFGKGIFLATGTPNPYKTALWLISCLFGVVFLQNSQELSRKFRTNLFWLTFVLALLFISLDNMRGYSEFIYFRF